MTLEEQFGDFKRPNPVTFNVADGEPIVRRGLARLSLKEKEHEALPKPKVSPEEGRNSKEKGVQFLPLGIPLEPPALVVDGASASAPMAPGEREKTWSKTSYWRTLF